MMIELVALALFTYQSAFAETEVSFPGQGLTLNGTLSIPKTERDLPAFLLLPGSGPTDRDGNQPPNFMTNVLKDLSVDLNRRGYATLRFDKRPVHRYAENWPKDMAAIAEFFSLENHLKDIESAVGFLRAQKGVDPKRIYLVGHSEGALFATDLGKRLGVQGMVLLGAPGRKMDVILAEQLHKNIGQLPDGKEKTTLLNDCDRAIDALKTGTSIPSGIDPRLASLFNPSSAVLLHGYFSIDPIAEAKMFDQPVFLANGEKDVQISAELDAKPLAKAFPKATLFIIPNASHNLKELKSANDPGIAGPISPALYEALGKWLEETIR